MAVEKTEKTCTMTLKVETGTSATGKATYANRTFGSMNPALSDDDMADIGKDIAGLQTYPLESVYRTDKAALTNAG